MYTQSHQMWSAHLLQFGGYEKLELGLQRWSVQIAVRGRPPKKNLSTILLGHKLNVCFAATLLCAGQFRDLIQCARATNVLKIDLYFSNEIQLGFHTTENNTVLRLLVTSLSRQVSRLHIETKRLSWLKHWLLTWKHTCCSLTAIWYPVCLKSFPFTSIYKL